MKNIKSIEPVNFESLLFNDLYTFSQMWMVMKLFPDLKVKFKFFDRNNTKYPDNFDVELKKIIKTFKNRKLSKQRRLEFQLSCPYLPNVFFDFLEGYTYDPDEITISLDNENHLIIEISGYLYRTLLWEVPLLAAISNLYFKMSNQVVDINNPEIIEIHNSKASWFNYHDINIVDFGTRRAYSPENHKNLIDSFITYGRDNFIGTSNVEMALANGIQPIGTMAHLSIMFHACLFGYSHCNKYMMDSWVQTYNGQLGTVLTDTYGVDHFLLDFDTKYANLFTGVRWDSGNPFVFTDKIINHYKKLNIDSKSKTIVYSDSLNLKLIQEIDDYKKGEIKKSYGVGTYLTNDLPYIKPLNIVIKLIEVNNLPAIKLSDEPKKATGDLETINYVKWIINNLLKYNI
jgi:nicotinate phosphoribosyltransferase